MSPSPPGLAAIVNWLLPDVRDSFKHHCEIFDLQSILPIREPFGCSNCDIHFLMFCWVKKYNMPPEVQLTTFLSATRSIFILRNGSDLQYSLLQHATWQSWKKMSTEMLCRSYEIRKPDIWIWTFLCEIRLSELG
jgi:hypothetical protein